MRTIDADRLRETIENHVTIVSVCPTADWSRGATQFKKQCLEDIDAAPTISGYKDELEEVLCVLEDQLNNIKWNIYPMSKDFDWIESAIRIIETIVARISTDEEATEDE
jgi:hypothetical protein